MMGFSLLKLHTKHGGRVEPLFWEGRGLHQRKRRIWGARQVKKKDQLPKERRKKK